jgi:hypothetical protein
MKTLILAHLRERWIAPTARDGEGNPQASPNRVNRAS